MDINTYSKFEFFWETRSPFSNFHPARFRMSVQQGGQDPAEYEFVHSEQAFMFCKALFAGDRRAADAILAATNPKECKRLGRRLRLDVNTWATHSKGVMRAANACKYAQNPALCSKLMQTGDKLLVEASPNDSQWGIGLTAAQARKMPPKDWPGSNRLGRVLTKLRDDFKRQGPFNEKACLP